MNTSNTFKKTPNATYANERRLLPDRLQQFLRVEGFREHFAFAIVHQPAGPLGVPQPNLSRPGSGEGENGQTAEDSLVVTALHDFVLTGQHLGGDGAGKDLEHEPSLPAGLLLPVFRRGELLEQEILVIIARQTPDPLRIQLEAPDVLHQSKCLLGLSSGTSGCFLRRHPGRRFAETAS